MRTVILVASVLLGACSTSDPPAPVRDRGPRDQPVIDAAADTTSVEPDVTRPDKGPKPDKAIKPDAGPCGNKKLDPGEECDRAIMTGQPGACPASTADCDDKNKCTTDGYAGAIGDCSAHCTQTPIPNCCGNGLVEAGEECDDGNVVDKDGCDNACKLPGGHLLITEVAMSPSEAEFIEIYNPGATEVALDRVFLSDRIDYFQIPKGGLSSASTDFIARFPDGAKLAPGSYATIAVQGSLYFKMAYGKAPTYELKNTETDAADMLPAFTGSIGSSAGLTDTGEVLVLFYWDGVSDLVPDIDYVVWKGSSASAISKSSSICIDGPDADTTATCYKNDMPITEQSYLAPPQQGGSIHRCNYIEGTEVKTGGNGQSGHDEASEPFDGAGATWKVNKSTIKFRTPGSTAPVGFCPQ